MANAGLQLLGFILAFLGWIGSIVSTALPQWRIYSYAGDNIVTAQAIYEGLWMSCVSQSTGQIQCKIFDSLLNLNSTLQATRALMVIGILLGLVAIFVATIGMKCMKCLEDNEAQKMRMAVIGGVIFLISGMNLVRLSSLAGLLLPSAFWEVPYFAAPVPRKQHRTHHQGPIQNLHLPVGKTTCDTEAKGDNPVGTIRK
ncbi:claudin-1 isoform X2 [Lagenorhynchus albirostris]|uniref:claudin-1 isoform X2 n=1 Tax=Lagenorhynchus albirostris TaxID=27610 RepID=UPI0028E3092D|nr:claudin-1 isoform X2 [Lagenorhynchus albirostris]